MVVSQAILYSTSVGFNHANYITENTSIKATAVTLADNERNDYNDIHKLTFPCLPKKLVLIKHLTN